jgi:hypothetical protein
VTATSDSREDTDLHHTTQPLHWPAVIPALLKREREPHNERLGLSEAIGFKLHGDVDIFQHGVESVFGFGRRDIADGLWQQPVIEPINPFQDCMNTTLVDHFGFVQPIDRLGQSSVIAITDTTDRRLNAELDETFGMFDKHILGFAVAVMNLITPIR